MHTAATVTGRLRRIGFAVALVPALILAACPDPETASTVTRPLPPRLEVLRQAPKFTPGEVYAGPERPGDGPKLVALVDEAIDDIAALPRPLDPERVRARLETLIDDVLFFTPADREQTYRYAVRIWRAAGFEGESKLFPRSDERILATP